MTSTTKLLAALLAAILLLAAGPARAQQRRLPPFVLGLGGGYDMASGGLVKGAGDDRPYDHSASIRLASLSFIFPKLFMDGWGLTMAIVYGDFDLQASGTGAGTVYIGGAPTSGSTFVDYRLAMRLALVELMSHMHIGGNARLELGPVAGVGFFPAWTEHEEIREPAGATLAGGALERNDSSSATNEGLFISGIGLRAGYEIPFVGGLALMPVVNLRGLVAIDGDGTAAAIVGTAGLGLSLLSGRTGGEPIEVLPAPIGALDTVRRVDTLRLVDTAAPALRLRAQLDLYSLDSAGRRSDTLVISLRRTLRRIEVPVESIVRFEPASAALAPRSVTDAAAAVEFDEEDLVALRPAEVRRRSLEVIAARLRRDPALRLSLTGIRGAGEPAWFAAARARSVRSYLQSVWDIDSSRVSIIARSTAGAATGVLVASATPGALDPVESEWIEQEVDAPPVGVQPTIIAAQGVQSWRVSVMQGTREVGVVRNTDEDAARRIDIGMALRRIPRDEASHALGAELVVEDSSGAVTVARDRMEIVVDGARAGGDARPESFLGEYVVAIADTAAAGGVIERLVRTLPIDATITVRAPIGHAEDAVRLERRLRAVAAARGREVGPILTASAEHDEGLDGSLMLISVRAPLEQ